MKEMIMNGAKRLSVRAAFMLALAAAAPKAWGQPTLAVGSGSGNPGATVNIDVNFDPRVSPSNVSVIHFDMQVPSGLSIDPTAIIDGLVVTSVKKTDQSSFANGVLSVVISGGVKTISAGTIVTLPFTIDAGAPSGPLALNVITADYSDPTPSNVAPGANSGGSITVNGGAPPPPPPPPPPPAPVVTSITLSPSAATISSSGQQQFSAVAKDQNGNAMSGITVAFNSDNTGAATIDASGLATGHNSGTSSLSAHITASASGVTSNQATLTVNGVAAPPPPPPPPATGDPTLSVGAVSGAAGSTVNLPIDFNPGGASVAVVTFDMVLPSGLTVDPNALQDGSIVTAAKKSDQSSFVNGVLTVVVSGGQTTIGSAGTLVTVPVQIDPSASGTLALSIRSVNYSDAANPPNLINAGANSDGSIAVTGGGAPPPPPPPPPSGGSVGSVNDLRVSQTADTSVTLAFTQVDDGTGAAASYDIRFALNPADQWWWGSGSEVPQGSCATPMRGTATTGNITCTVLGLQPSTAYQFQLVPFRGTLNSGTAVFGSLSNIASATTLASAPPPPLPPPPPPSGGGTIAIGVAPDSTGATLTITGSPTILEFAYYGNMTPSAVQGFTSGTSGVFRHNFGWAATTSTDRWVCYYANGDHNNGFCNQIPTGGSTPPPAPPPPGGGTPPPPTSGGPSLTVGTGSGQAGTTVNIPVDFKPNGSSVSVIHFQLQLAAGLTIDPNAILDGSVITSVKKSDQSSFANGILSVVISGGARTVSSGTIVTLPIAIGSSASGTLALKVLSADYSDPSPATVVAGANTDGAVTVGAGTGGTPPPPPPTNHAPVVSAIGTNAIDVDAAASGLQIYDNTQVSYSGSATDADNDPLTYKWIYTVNGGAEIIMAQGTGAVQPFTFNYPAGIAPKSYTWILRVSDGKTSVDSKLNVDVIVRPTSGGGTGGGTSTDKVLILSPKDGAIVRTSMSVRIGGTGAAGVKRVELYGDGALVASADYATPLKAVATTLAFKTTRGRHQLMARVIDTAGNTLSSSVITVTAARMRSTGLVSLVQQSGGTSGTGTLSASQSASDAAQDAADESSTPRALLLSFSRGSTQSLLFDDEVQEAKLITLSGHVIMEQRKSGAPILMTLQQSGDGRLKLESGLMFAQSRTESGETTIQPIVVAK